MKNLRERLTQCNYVTEEEMKAFYEGLCKINGIGKDKIYLVEYSMGSYDDYIEKVCFATFNFAKAFNHVEKGNRIVDMAKNHYLDENGELKEKYENTFIEDAYLNYCDFNNYFIQEVEFK